MKNSEVKYVKALTISSRVAQWKRAGPITQRSEDQNLALLVYFYYLKECLKTFNFLLFIYFSSMKLKKNDATGNKFERMRATKMIGRLYMALSTYWCPRVKS